MSNIDPETEMKLYKRFILVCRKCNHQFLPWHCFSLNTEKTGWEDAHYCPNCGNLAKDKEYDRLTELEKLAETE
jgi:hypothetical protein